MRCTVESFYLLLLLYLGHFPMLIVLENIFKWLQKYTIKACTIVELMGSSIVDHLNCFYVWLGFVFWFLFPSSHPHCYKLQGNFLLIESSSGFPS